MEDGTLRPLDRYNDTFMDPVYEAHCRISMGIGCIGIDQHPNVVKEDTHFVLSHRHTCTVLDPKYE